MLIDRAIRAEAHHACKFGLAVGLGQQQHAVAEARSDIECAERVARV